MTYSITIAVLGIVSVVDGSYRRSMICMAKVGCEYVKSVWKKRG